MKWVEENKDSYNGYYKTTVEEQVTQNSPSKQVLRETRNTGRTRSRIGRKEGSEEEDKSGQCEDAEQYKRLV